MPSPLTATYSVLFAVAGVFMLAGLILLGLALDPPGNKRLVNGGIWPGVGLMVATAVFLLFAFLVLYEVI